MITLGEISKTEAARYMGIRTVPDEQTAAMINMKKSSVTGLNLPMSIAKQMWKFRLMGYIFQDFLLYLPERVSASIWIAVAGQ